MPKESVLGPQADRIKTDLRLPKEFVVVVEEACRKLGVPKNAFFVLAGALFLAQLEPAMKSKKSDKLLEDLEILVQNLIFNIKKSL